MCVRVYVAVVCPCVCEGVLLVLTLVVRFFSLVSFTCVFCVWVLFFVHASLCVFLVRVLFRYVCVGMLAYVCARVFCVCGVGISALCVFVCEHA